jgi:hypothetical protein
MFIATSLIVLFIIPCILFTTFIIWLAHSLEGYPAFMISNTKRDGTHPARTQLALNRSALLDALANTRSLRRRPELWAGCTIVPRTYDYHRTK